MNDRQRFRAVMSYQNRDRCPMYDFNYWAETIPEWHQQGLPGEVTNLNAVDYFGMDYSLGSGAPEPLKPSYSVHLCPHFEHKVLEDRGDHELVQQGDGVRVLRKKYMGSIPMHEGHLLTDYASWLKHYKPKLDPTTPARFPKDWDQHADHWRDETREDSIFLHAGSLYGWLRNWMGVENLSLVVYDEPAWFEEMVNTVTDVIIAGLEKVLATGGKFDGCGMWEDMCYNAGPLLGPEHFDKFLVPQYRRITDLLHRHGITTIWVDCDGCIDALAPLWLKAGVNCMFPIEIGTWGADPIKFRQRFGKEMLLMGGFDKHLLAQSPSAITAEIHRLTPLVEEGGFIPFCDHRVPPDVPLVNYLHYLKVSREVWGRNVNLKPAPGLELLEQLACQK